MEEFIAPQLIWGASTHQPSPLFWVSYGIASFIVSSLDMKITKICRNIVKDGIECKIDISSTGKRMWELFFHFLTVFDSFWQFFRQFSELFSDLLFGKGFPQFFFDNYLDLVSRSFLICKVLFNLMYTMRTNLPKKSDQLIFSKFY